jgi:hypothetical protein
MKLLKEIKWKVYIVHHHHQLEFIMQLEFQKKISKVFRRDFIQFKTNNINRKKK